MSIHTYIHTYIHTGLITQVEFSCSQNTCKGSTLAPSSLSPVRRGSQRLSERRWAGRPPPNVADSLAVCRAPGRPVSSATWAAGSAVARQPIGPARPSASDRRSAVDWPAGTGHPAALSQWSAAAAAEGSQLRPVYQYTGRGQRRSLSGRLPRRRTSGRLALGCPNRDTFRQPAPPAAPVT